MTSLITGESIQMGAGQNQAPIAGAERVEENGNAKQLIFVGMAMLAMTTMVVGMTMDKFQPWQWMFLVFVISVTK